MIGRILSRTAVAPHTGAWIEIRRVLAINSRKASHPHTGAWIEILKSSNNLADVAPHMGAWIEISTEYNN